MYKIYINQNVLVISQLDNSSQEVLHNATNNSESEVLTISKEEIITWIKKYEDVYNSLNWTNNFYKIMYTDILMMVMVVEALMVIITMAIFLDM